MHDLQRTAARWIAQLGYAEFVIRRFLGHSTKGVTGVDARMGGAEAIRKAVEDYGRRRRRRHWSGGCEGESVTCPSCGQGETERGTTELSLEIDDGRVSFVDVPALICAECGAMYFAEEAVRWMLDQHEEATKGLEIIAGFDLDSDTENQ